MGVVSKMTRSAVNLFCCFHNYGDEHVQEDESNRDVKGPEVDDRRVRRQGVPEDATMKKKQVSQRPGALTWECTHRCTPASS